MGLGGLQVDVVVVRGEELLGEDVLHAVDPVVEDRREEAHLVRVRVRVRVSVENRREEAHLARGAVAGAGAWPQ